MFHYESFLYGRLILPSENSIPPVVIRIMSFFRFYLNARARPIKNSLA